MLENRSDRFAFLLIDDQASIVEIIPQRDILSHPHSLLLRGGNFIPNAFSGQSVASGTSHQ